MLIRNNQQRIVRAFDKVGGSVMILPGTNQLSAKVWESLKSNQHFAKSVARGDIEVIIEDEPKAGESPISSSVFSNVRGAMDAIRSTFDPALLKQWLEAEQKGENRKTIVQTIEEQLARLEKTKKEMKESAKAKAQKDSATVEGEDDTEDEEENDDAGGE